MMTDSGLPILDLWPSWELDLRACNRSTATIRNYRLHLHTFADHLTESGHSGAADEIERRHVEALIADQRPQEWGRVRAGSQRPPTRVVPSASIGPVRFVGASRSTSCRRSWPTPSVSTAFKSTGIGADRSPTSQAGVPSTTRAEPRRPPVGGHSR